MIKKPMDILTLYPVRKSRRQKKAFREDVCAYAQSLGYECRIEKGSLGSRNIVIGNPETAEHLITAHYDTCANMLLPNLITPCNFLLFLLYQLLLTAVMLVPAVLIGMLVGIIVRQPQVGEFTFLVTLFAVLLLMMYGPANRHNANDNTSGVVAALEIAGSFPKDQRDKVCFVLFDLEEAGLIGSSSYRSSHKKDSQNQLVWNLDCIGEGDDVVFFPSKKVRKNERKMETLQRCVTKLATKRISIRQKGFSFYPSDQANFPYGVGIAALKRSKFGLYLDRIHTNKDTVLDETNVNILRAAIISAITCDGVQ
ncbi:MAG: M28 family peptidase [Oscillospiraceae bacterium]|nr:M28 family peptidase [Oscillospiraceae bacterium]